MPVSGALGEYFSPCPPENGETRQIRKTRAELSADTPSREGDSPPVKTPRAAPPRPRTSFRGFPAKPGRDCPSHHLSGKMWLRALATGVRVSLAPGTDALPAPPAEFLTPGWTCAPEFGASAAEALPRPGRAGLRRGVPRTAASDGGSLAPAARRAAATRHVLCPFVERTSPAQRPRRQKLAEGGTSRTPLSRPVRLLLSCACGD